MAIKNANLKFKETPTKRKSTKKIILHHSGVSVLQSVETIHNFYLTRDGGKYIGIGYHFYVRKNGEVWQGRPIEAVGGHCYEENEDSIGFCFEGNFETETMSLGQFQAGVDLLKYILAKYPKSAIKKHNDFNSTDCPGKNFPFDKMAKEAVAVAPKPPVVVKPKPVNLYAKGRKISLKNTPLFASSSDNISRRQVSGNYYLWDGKLINGKYRITNTPEHVGLPEQITGWILKGAIK